MQDVQVKLLAERALKVREVLQRDGREAPIRWRLRNILMAGKLPASGLLFVR